MNHTSNNGASPSHDDIAGREAELRDHVRNVPGRLRRLVNQVSLLFSLVRDFSAGRYDDISFASIGIAVGAIIYFLSPVDAIPDFIFGIGFTDDAAVVALASASLEAELRKYCVWRGLDTRQYFK